MKDRIELYYSFNVNKCFLTLSSGLGFSKGFINPRDPNLLVACSNLVMKFFCLQPLYSVSSPSGRSKVRVRYTQRSWSWYSCSVSPKNSLSGANAAGNWPLDIQTEGGLSPHGAIVPPRWCYADPFTPTYWAVSAVSGQWSSRRWLLSLTGRRLTVLVK